MSSTNTVNFSLRQNKTIERAIVFSGLQALYSALQIPEIVYVGLGSVWFADFDLAHRELGIEQMISIEADPIVARRAEFNKPFKTIEVVPGSSYQVMPELLQRHDLITLPWIVWLDFDKGMDQERLEELQSLVQRLPPNSTLLTTFSANPAAYGDRKLRAALFESIFGDVLPEGLPNATYREAAKLTGLLADVLHDSLLSKSKRVARLGGLLPAFTVPYQDVSPMVTVGVFLPSEADRDRSAQVLADSVWEGLRSDPIAVPPLTAKEVLALQAELPSPAGVSRARVQEIGFDLDDTHLASFVANYLRYPNFAQLSR